jgi:hypothetical protein
MLTPRRSAQLGLGAACLILVSSIAVLVAGAADSGKDRDVQGTQSISTPKAPSQATRNDTAGLLSASTLTQTIAVASKP